MNFVMLTKSDLKAVQELFNEFAETLKREIKDKVITRLDKVIGELKSVREEQTIISGKHSEYTDTLEDHETRISTLEQILKP